MEDLGGPVLPWWRLENMIEHLPSSSPFVIEYTEGEREETIWGLQEHLLADLLYLTQMNNYLLGQLRADWSQTKNVMPEPKVIPRPGVKEPSKSKGSGLMGLVRKLGAPVN